MPETDFYAVLGLGRDATADEIKRNFRRLAAKWHPDKPDGNEQKFREIEEAYRVLSDPQDRAYYDHHGAGPEKHERNENAQLYAMLAATLATVITQTEDVTAIDLIAEMRKVIMRGQQELDRQIADVHKSMRKFDIARKRIKSRTEENVLVATLKSQIDGMQHELKKGDELRALGVKGLQILDDYEYDWTRQLEYADALRRPTQYRFVDLKWGGP
jgi:DnaJ-class molecular chaperone